MTESKAFQYIKGCVTQCKMALLPAEHLVVQIDVAEKGAFYIEQEGKTCIHVEPFFFDYYDVRLICAEKDLIQSFKKPDYFLSACMKGKIKVDGTFEKVMLLQKLIDAVIKGNASEKKIGTSNVLPKDIQRTLTAIAEQQKQLNSDMQIMIETLHLLLSNLLLNDVSQLMKEKKPRKNTSKKKTAQPSQQKKG